MISSLFSDSTFIIVSLMALVFTIVAISQKLNDAIKGISIVYVIFILYTLSSENTSFKKDQDTSSINIIDYNEPEGYDLSEDISSPQNNVNNEFDSLNIDELIDDLARKSSINSNKRSWISSRSLKNNTIRPIKLLSIEIGDNVVSRNIEGKRKSFNADDKRVYCLTRIENTNDFRTTIFHKWYKDLKLESNILINIGKSYNWRSWSYININSERVGNWKVVIEDSSGFKYDSLEFSISQK
jgi:hypothetical protein